MARRIKSKELDTRAARLKLKPRKGKPYVKKEETDVVLGMRERGGRLRLVHVKDATGDVTSRTLEKHISPDAMLQTDAHATFEINRIKGQVRWPSDD